MVFTCVLVPSSRAGLQGSDDPVPAGRTGFDCGLCAGTQVHQDRQNFGAGQRPDGPEWRDPVHPVRYVTRNRLSSTTGQFHCPQLLDLCQIQLVLMMGTFFLFLLELQYLKISVSCDDSVQCYMIRILNQTSKDVLHHLMSGSSLLHESIDY